ncbi:MAG: polyphosphate kinase 1 [Chitinophagales bacterium]|nr:polyphosphate kinase 1 [Sphingobacteriales bacterium]MBP7534114.1 polyphosphate kinase 1 [Chitinophagales bacterium]
MPHKKIIIERDISWLHFNERVLQEAADEKVPLLMRLKFLGIFSNNLDEFFRVRVATHQRLMGLNRETAITQRKILKQIHQNVVAQQQHFEEIYAQILTQLKAYQIHIVNEKELTTEQGEIVRAYFHDTVRPLLVPLMLDQIVEFPALKDGCIYLALCLAERKKNSIEKPHFALIELPTEKLSRFFVFKQEDNTFVILLDDVVRYCLNDIFAIFGYNDCRAYTVKVTKDAEMDLDVDVSKSFMELIALGVKKRKFGNMVRFIYDQEIDANLLTFLLKKLRIKKTDNHIAAGRYHNFKDFMGFPSVGSAALNKRPDTPMLHPAIDPKQSLFKLIRKKDVMLHFPYHSFHPVIDFLREAAIDPKVLFIKITIYRVAKQSNIINALINARKNGKQVTATIEIQARFDEEANIEWVKSLQENGITVLHGQQGIKIHSKLILVGRRENNKTVLYANVSTGNFHEGTARTYSDDSLLTADPQITREVAKVFDMIERKEYYSFKHLLVSPHQMLNKILTFIDTEIRNARANKTAYIIAKLNSLNDEEVIQKLYEAAKAGVKITLIIRGICTLVPQENIEIFSIVDKYLEHSRVYVFADGGKERIYIASADWMERNLHRRIEVACPIYDTQIRNEIKTMLAYQQKDNTKSRLINAPEVNAYKIDDQAPFRYQNKMYDYFKNK